MNYILILLFLYFVSASVDNSSAIPNEDGCLCKTYSCGCCVTVDVPQILLNDTGCIGVAYLPDEYGIAVTFTIDGDAIINETISARNPPPLCMEPPEMDVYLHICLRFYDLSIKGSTFHACVQIEFKMFYIFTLTEIKLGCFELGTPSLKHSQHLYKLLSSDAERSSNSSKNQDTYPDWKTFKKVLDSKMVDFWKFVSNKTVSYEKIVEAEAVDLWKIVSDETVRFRKNVEIGAVDFGRNVGEKMAKFGKAIENEIYHIETAPKNLEPVAADVKKKVENKTAKHEPLVSPKAPENSALNLRIHPLLINFLWGLVLLELFQF